ncbi:MAG: GIY-YIG nuclease family protein [Terracidiphilus sp.]
MSESAEFLQCPCLHCGQNLEFPAEGLGTAIECPTCHQRTMLLRPDPVPAPIQPVSAKSEATRLGESFANALESRQKLETDNPPSLLRQERCGPAYVITLSPGQVRYLAASDFLQADIENVISEIKRTAQAPIITNPHSYFCHDDEWSERFLFLDKYDELLRDESWEPRLRLHHRILLMAVNEGIPIGLYHSFHSHLQLGGEFAFCECLQAWVKEAYRNGDITESYKASQEHLVLGKNTGCVSVGGKLYSESRLVFRKTDFVKKKLRELAEAAEAQAAKENLETLNKSRFESFVYIMEDCRNGTFKIGRSKTPGKRERTLQSEVPEIVLRFSIPAADDDERRLHDRFDPKRLRGEWFNLTADELLWIISFLKKNGDASRASADYEWVGRITLKASPKTLGE